MITILTNDQVEQGTDKWLELRAKYITGTNAYDILNGKTIEQVLAKKQSDLEKHWNGNYYTQRGHELESIGILLYGKIYKYDVNHEVGFVLNDKYSQAGYSPDGLVGEDGLVEHKAFQEKRHFQVYESLDPHIIAQIQFGLFVTERKWCDLILFNPDLEAPKDRLLVRRIKPERSIQQKLKELFQS